MVPVTQNCSVIIDAQADAAPTGRHFGNTGSGSNWHWSTVTAKEYLHLLVTTKQNILTSSARLNSINAIFRQLKQERKTITVCNKKT